MKLKDAIHKSIRSYYKGELPEQAIEASEKEFKYTMDYFDKMLSENKTTKVTDDAED